MSRILGYYNMISNVRYKKHISININYEFSIKHQVAVTWHCVCGLSRVQKWIVYVRVVTVRAVFLLLKWNQTPLLTSYFPETLDLLGVFITTLNAWLDLSNISSWISLYYCTKYLINIELMYDFIFNIN